MTDAILSRRDFLKLSGATLLGLLFSELHLDRTRAAASTMQGRVVYPRLVVRDAPAFSGKKVKSYTRDTVLTVIEQVAGGVESDYNRLWYRLGEDEYVYSGGVQPVDTVLNETISDIPELGGVGEVTVPFADSSWAINRNPVPGPRLYYASTHWVKGLVTDQRDGSLWYKIYDNLYQAYYFTRPEWVHILTSDELAPLAPDVPEEEKQIQVILERQMLLAFEGDSLVHTARTATGKPGFETPTGMFQTFHKRPTAHMTGGADIASVFDLPGVPWDSYFTEAGAALHGTYWHNDFGHTHSHGCVNLAPGDARWIFRWTLPSVPPDQRLVYQPGYGTLVCVADTYTPPGRVRHAVRLPGGRNSAWRTV